MAQGVGSAVSSNVTALQDTFGGKLYGPVDYKGPTSYVQGGDALDPNIFGCPNAVISVIGGVDQSGTYFVCGRAMIDGIGAQQLVWMNVDGTGEVSAATNLSGYTVRISAVGI